MDQKISNSEGAPQKPKNMVPWSERFSYSLSDFACNLSFQMVGTYLMIFYTDTFGISAAAVGTLFFVARFFDAVDGPIWGILIDHTHTRFGKSRPYWLWFSIPFAVFCVLNMHVKMQRMTTKSNQPTII